MHDRLTDAQQTAFREDGYLVLEGLLNVAECTALRDEVDALAHRRTGALAAAGTRTYTIRAASSISMACGHR